MKWPKNSKIKFSYDKLYTEKIPIPRTHKRWATGYKKIQEYIRFHHSVVQDDLCAYCRSPIRFNGYGEPIEHIVPKSHKPGWMLHPKNLCLSCYGCNTKKSQADTLVGGKAAYSKKYADYPKTSAEFTIFHPHYDKFSHHLIIDKLICKPKPGINKGQSTIEVCKLNRLDLLYARARQKNISKNQIYLAALRIVSHGGHDPQLVKASGEMINELIKRYKYSNELAQ